MGARASRRRHEGRRIRRWRRLGNDLSTKFNELGKAATASAKPMAAFADSFRGFSEQIASWEQRRTPALVLSQVPPPYPTQSGVGELRTAPVAPPELRGPDAPYAWVDEIVEWRP